MRNISKKRTCLGFWDFTEAVNQVVLIVSYGSHEEGLCEGMVFLRTQKSVWIEKIS